MVALIILLIYMFENRIQSPTPPRLRHCIPSESTLLQPLELSNQSVTWVDGDEAPFNKLGFLFLTADEFPLGEIWDCWLDKYKTKLAMWMAYKKSCPSFCVAKPLCHCVPAQSIWAGLPQVYLGLLAEALKDPTKQHFILISDSTIPLKPFEYVINQSTQWKNSLVCPFGDHYKREDQYYRRHHQWVILNRQHAEILLESLLNLDGHVKSEEGDALSEYLMSLFITKQAKTLSDSELAAWWDFSNISMGCHTFVRWAQTSAYFLAIPPDPSDQDLIIHPYLFTQMPEEAFITLAKQPDYFFGRRFHPWTKIGNTPLNTALCILFNWKHCP